MIRVLLFAGLLLAPMASFAVDDLKVSQLEQDVRDLQRQVQALTRRLEQPPPSPAVPASQVPHRPAETSGAPAPRWVDAAKWQRIQPGMGELQVLELLGPPTSMRVVEGDRVLFYALEIGASGFLGGSVRLRDHAVLSVRTPSLQ